MIPENAKTRAMRYAQRIRNKAKRQYAVDWLAHLDVGSADPPAHPNLSVMAAQAVRMQLYEMLRGEP